LFEHQKPTSFDGLLVARKKKRKRNMKRKGLS
jgi:hypothetical protein